MIQCPADDSRVRCKVCNRDISIAHGGRDDIEKHLATKAHERALEESKKLGKINTFFRQPVATTNGSSEFELSVTNAEVTFASFLVEHFVALSASDHAGAVFRKMFPTFFNTLK